MKHSRARSLVIRLLLVFAALLFCQEHGGAQQQEGSGIPKGYKIIEGDIVVREDFGKTAGTWTLALWPRGIVNYIFDSTVSQVNQATARAAMGVWEAAANVSFVPRPTFSNVLNYIRIHDSSNDSRSNNSQVGMNGGEQVVNIAAWNSGYVIVHELGHALGFWHEQSRPGRGEYVQINYANVCQNCCSGGPCNYNFDEQKRAGKYGPYDFDSIMHYGAFDFSISHTPTIQVLPQWLTTPIEFSHPRQAGNGNCYSMLSTGRTWQDQIGQRSHLSYWDCRVMSFLYPQSDWRFVDQTHAGGENGSFLNPFRQFADGVNTLPAGGTVWVLEPGHYVAIGTYTKRMTIQAPQGGVVLGK